jgi:hypothetical protein
MNFIISPTRALLMVKVISSLLFLKIVGPPLTHLNHTKYVDLWLFKECHSTIDTNSKERNGDIVWNKNLIKIRNLL